MTQRFSNSSPGLNFPGAELAVVSESLGLADLPIHLPGTANKEADFLSRPDCWANTPPYCRKHWRGFRSRRLLSGRLIGIASNLQVQTKQTGKVQKLCWLPGQPVNTAAIQAGPKRVKVKEGRKGRASKDGGPSRTRSGFFVDGRASVVFAGSNGGGFWRPGNSPS